MIIKGYGTLEEVREAHSRGNYSTSAYSDILFDTLDMLQEAEARERVLVEALEGVDKHSFTTYKAKNGKEVGIQDGSGEKCFIVPSDALHRVNQALATLPAQALERYRLERDVILIAEMLVVETPIVKATTALALIEAVEALQAHNEQAGG